MYLLISCGKERNDRPVYIHTQKSDDIKALSKELLSIMFNNWENSEKEEILKRKKNNEISDEVFLKTEMIKLLEKNESIMYSFYRSYNYTYEDGLLTYLTEVYGGEDEYAGDTYKIVEI